MIIINPAMDTKHEDTDALRKHINYIFADMLREYIELKGDSVRLSRKSESAPAVTLKSLKANYSPSVVITVDCYADIDETVSGYSVDCDAYSALVGTIIYEMYKQGRKAISSTGYRETSVLEYGTYADITIYLGYITNADEREWLSDEDNLRTLAKRIIEGAYGPPVKQVTNTDPAGNDDPYFYSFDMWQETEAYDGSSAEIKETTKDGLPVRYINIRGVKNSVISVVDDTTGETEEVITPYTWEIPLTYTDTVTECLFIGSVRAPSGTGHAYMKVGDTEYEEEITDTSFKVVIFQADVVPDDKVYIGVKGTSRLEYSGIWVAPTPKLGSLDDPRASYSIFPPGYRTTEKVSSAYNSANAFKIALTNAKSLVERAQDKGSASSGSTETTTTATSTSSSSSSSGALSVLSSGISFVGSALTYATAISKLYSMLSSKNKSTMKLTDAATINSNFSALEKTLLKDTSVKSQMEKTAVINDMKSISDAKDGNVVFDPQSQDFLKEKAEYNTAAANYFKSKTEAEEAAKAQTEAEKEAATATANAESASKALADAQASGASSEEIAKLKKASDEANTESTKANTAATKAAETATAKKNAIAGKRNEVLNKYAKVQQAIADKRKKELAKLQEEKEKKQKQLDKINAKNLKKAQEKGTGIDPNLNNSVNKNTVTKSTTVETTSVYNTVVERAAISRSSSEINK